MEFKLFFGALFSFIALVNPIQKLLVVVSLQENYSEDDLKKIVNRSNRTALEVLIVFLLVGEVLLNYVFGIQVYAFQTTCGLVLLYNGFMGLQKGSFLSLTPTTKIEEIIAVPIAVPMIAGPATITAVVSMPSIYGKLITGIAVVIAIFINWIIMRNSNVITKVLTKYNILMPLIRIIGLIVAAIGAQMIFSGISTFIHQL